MGHWQGEWRSEPPERGVARIMLRREWETIRQRFAEEAWAAVEARQKRITEEMIEAVEWGIAFLEQSIRQQSCERNETHR